MGSSHSTAAAEANGVATPAVVTANVAATNAVANATGVTSPETVAQADAATAVINASKGVVTTGAVATVSDCCVPHVNLALAGVTSA